ncbi:hypothetical protein JCM8547_001988 [Rhodosporidiobolus lusitaniae]
MPKPTLATGFEWDGVFEELMEQTATSNVVDADWPILKDMIKYKLAEAITGFLQMGPPWPLAPEDALQARKRAFDTLDSFAGPPFTIQRLCELALRPRSVYTSLPKYLRAVNRVLSVTSERSAFAEDDFSSDPLQAIASTSAHTLDTTLGVVSGGVIRSPAHHNRRGSIPGLAGTPRPPRSPSPAFSTASSSSSRSSISSSSSQHPPSSPSVVPLLSPIPWLTTRPSSASPPHAHPSLSSPLDALPLSPPLPASSPSSASPRLGTVSLPLEEGGPLYSPPKAIPSPAATTTPSGGLVDEVDDGSGTSEVVEPVALTHAAEEEMAGSPEKGEARAGGNGLLDVTTTTSLRERFVRASSPRVERPELEVEGEEGGENSAEGGKMETDAP